MFCIKLTLATINFKILINHLFFILHKVSVSELKMDLPYSYSSFWVHLLCTTLGFVIVINYQLICFPFPFICSKSMSGVKAWISCDQLLTLFVFFMTE